MVKLLNEIWKFKELGMLYSNRLFSAENANDLYRMIAEIVK